jgi:voltage-gated potassium channel
VPRVAIPASGSLRERAHEIIFEAETPAGRAFDIALMVAIVASVGAVMLESVTWVRLRYGTELRLAEWVFTGLFSLEWWASSSAPVNERTALVFLFSLTCES